VGSEVRAATPLADFRWPPKSVLVLGHEQRGLTRAVAERCDLSVRIAGSDQLDSLNVSVAAGVFLASYAAAHPARSSAARGQRGLHA
jgi:TrmH RNA methyltransferase